MHQQKTCLELFLPQQNVVFPVQSQAVFHVFDPILPLATIQEYTFAYFLYARIKQLISIFR